MKKTAYKGVLWHYVHTKFHRNPSMVSKAINKEVKYHLQSDGTTSEVQSRPAHPSGPRWITFHFFRLGSIATVHLQLGLFPLRFSTKMRAFIVAHMRATCPTHPILFDLITIIIFIQEYKLWIYPLCSFSPASCHVISLRSKYSPQHRALKHPQSVFSHHKRPSFTPIQRTSIIIFEYILIFTFLGSTNGEAREMHTEFIRNKCKEETVWEI